MKQKRTTAQNIYVWGEIKEIKYLNVSCQSLLYWVSYATLMTGWTAKIYGRLSHHFIFYLKKKKSKFQKLSRRRPCSKDRFHTNVTAAILQYKTMNMLAKQQTKKFCGD